MTIRARAVSTSVQVECYSGYTYAQEPRAFEWQGRQYTVVRVVKRWRTPTGPTFRVEVAVRDSQVSNVEPPLPNLVDLHYRELEDTWRMSVQD